LIPQVFLDYMAENGYRDVEVKRFKKHDRIRYKTTPQTGWPNVQIVEVGLRRIHIEDFKPEHYWEIAMPLDERFLIQATGFMARSMALESGLPYLPPYYSERCDRCGRMVDDLLFPAIVEDDVGEDVEMITCEDCNHEMINGDNPFMDRADIWDMRRQG